MDEMVDNVFLVLGLVMIVVTLDMLNRYPLFKEILNLIW